MFLTATTENHGLDSIFFIADLQTRGERTGPKNSENHPSNDQTFQTSVQTDGQLLI